MDSKKITGSNIYLMATYAIMTALMCIFGPVSVPIGPIPISLTNLILYFSIYIIGMRGTTISYIVYMLLGVVGLPVFSGYQGGVAKLAGPTGGYLIGFVLLALISGFAFEKSSGKLRVPVTIGGMIAGTLVAYIFGTVWFVAMMQCEVAYALSVCVFPFIPFDLAKIVIASALGMAVRKPLCKQGFISE